MCKLFAQRGVSDLVPSGDSGVGSGNCGDGSGNNDFIPEFPSTCMCDVLSRLTSTTQVQVQIANQTAIGPFITNVGGTTFETYKDQEVAASFSGGGFSDYFPRQRYQARAVSEFLQNLGGKYAGLYKYAHDLNLTRPFLLCNLCSSAGRAYPDIAKQALRSDVIVGNAEIILTGAGCSTSVCLALLLPPLRIVHPQAPS